MTDLVKFPDAVEAKWSSGEPTLATSGGIFLEGDIWGAWEGRLAVATLAGERLWIFEFNDSDVLVSKMSASDLGTTYGRLRTPIIGPDSALYLTTSNSSGVDRILRVTPKQPPSFETDSLSIAVPEDTPPGSHIASVDANHFNHDPLSYSLSGAGSAPFRIAEADVGDIVLDSALDHETDASHDITVTVTDSDGMTDTMTVTVTVTDSDDTGTLALSPTQPQVGVALRATVNDPDGGAEHAVWTWERSQAQDDWLLISEATGSVYLPKSADLGYRLRVTVAYSDAYGTGKQLQAVSARTAESAVVYPTGNRLSTAARDLLVDYLPSGVLVMGGTSAISEATLAAARQASESDSVRRILGATRAETAAAVASRILEGSSDGDTTVVVVNG